MQTKLLTKTKVLTLDKKVLFILLKNEEYSRFSILNSTMQSYIISGIKYPYVEIEQKGEDIRKQIKPFLKQADLIVVLFANTPLISGKTIENIVEYASIKEVKACKLPCGFVFDSKYLKKNKVVSFDAIYSQNENEFLEVTNEETYKLATKILQDRIINYHIKNGVKFENEQGAIVEPTVDIERGVIVSSNVYLRGNTYVGENASIKENSTIKDCTIGKNVSISNSQILNSKIGDNSIIMPYSYISNSQIGKDVLIKSNKRIENEVVLDNKTIE